MAYSTSRRPTRLAQEHHRLPEKEPAVAVCFGRRSQHYKLSGLAIRKARIAARQSTGDGCDLLDFGSGNGAHGQRATFLHDLKRLTTQAALHLLAWCSRSAEVQSYMATRAFRIYVRLGPHQRVLDACIFPKWIVLLH